MSTCLYAHEALPLSARPQPGHQRQQRLRKGADVVAHALDDEVDEMEGLWVEWGRERWHLEACMGPCLGHLQTTAQHVAWTKPSGTFSSYFTLLSSL